MTHRHNPALPALRLLAILVGLVFSQAHADEYADVTQLVRAGKLADALTKADQYLANKPRDPQMRFLKGVIQRDSGKPVEAITTFTKLTEDFPELPEPYNNLAVLYAGQSQFDKARTALEMAIRTNPSYATAHENLGDVYAKLASQAYTKALQLDTANQAVAPKLALIRELFNPTAKGQKPTLPQPVPVSATPKAPASSAVAAIKPAATASSAQVAASAPSAAATPVAAPATLAGADTSAKEVESAVHNWASAWSAKDMKAYLAAYGKEFDPSGAQNRTVWEEERRKRIVGKSQISVKLDNIIVSVSGTSATAKFRQNYKADGLSVSSKKTLTLVKKGDQWQIVKESVGS